MNTKFVILFVSEVVSFFGFLIIEYVAIIVFKAMYMYLKLQD